MRVAGRWGLGFGVVAWARVRGVLGDLKCRKNAWFCWILGYFLVFLGSVADLIQEFQLQDTSCGSENVGSNRTVTGRSGNAMAAAYSTDSVE